MKEFISEKFNIQKSEKAKELFLKGYNCSQSVMGAWCGDFGLDFDTAIKISSSFGGGMGRLREVCGACSGAFMVLGLKYGYSDPSKSEQKAELYEIIQRFAARFKEENGKDTIICREMLGLTGESKPQPAPRTQEYYKKRPCSELVAIASGLLGEF